MTPTELDRPGLGCLQLLTATSSVPDDRRRYQLEIPTVGNCVVDNFELSTKL